jgi:hypothetical protein
MRFTTKQYVTDNENEALRLAVLDGTHKDDIRRSEVRLLHASNDFSYWSDGRITRPVFGKSIIGLSSDADYLIASVVGSDSGWSSSRWEVDLLPEVTSIIARFVVWRGGRYGTGFKSQEIEEIHLRLNNGSSRVMWMYSVGYSEGYDLSLHETRESAEQEAMQ